MLGKDKAAEAKEDGTVCRRRKRRRKRKEERGREKDEG
jgi:hypothetical protein